MVCVYRVFSTWSWICSKGSGLPKSYCKSEAFAKVLGSASSLASASNLLHEVRRSISLSPALVSAAADCLEAQFHRSGLGLGLGFPGLGFRLELSGRSRQIRAVSKFKRMQSEASDPEPSKRNSHLPGGGGQVAGGRVAAATPPRFWGFWVRCFRHFRAQLPKPEAIKEKTHELKHGLGVFTCWCGPAFVCHCLPRASLRVDAETLLPIGSLVVPF